MANKTANVNARVEENVKTKAEGILSAMGIPAGGDTAGFRFVLIYAEEEWFHSGSGGRTTEED